MRASTSVPVLVCVLVACARPAAEAPPSTEVETTGSAPPAGPMDHHPARRTPSPTGRYEARVDEQRRLRLHGGEQLRLLDEAADPRVVFAPDEGRLVWARIDPLGETDLWGATLPDGAPAALVTGPGSQDRPVLSPDGRRLAFVSGHTGIAAWFVVELDGALPVDVRGATQLTNRDLVRLPGQAPAGFVPVPTTDPPTWDDQGLSWVAQGRSHRVAVPR